MEEGLVVQASALPTFSGQQMVQALQQYKALQVELDKAMPDSVMELAGKKFRKKNFWRAIAVAFNLSVEPTEERREVSGSFDDGRENFGFIITYRASTQSGRSATGDGACFAIEKAPRFKCPHPEKEGSTRTLHWPSETCPDYANFSPWRACPAQATEHNIRSHAHTRAFNRAVSNLVGFGEVSAEEVDREEHATETTKSAGSGSTAAAAPKPAVSADGSTKVKEVKDKPSEKKPGRVLFEDGRDLSTFDDKLLDLAKQAKAEGWTVLVKTETKTKGDKTYTNLSGLERVVVQDQALPLEDTEPVGGPEKVLFTLPLERAGKPPAWKIQTDRRVYFTEVEGQSLLAKGAKDDGKPIVVVFTPEKTATGTYNIVKAGGITVAEAVPA